MPLVPRVEEKVEGVEVEKAIINKESTTLHWSLPTSLIGRRREAVHREDVCDHAGSFTEYTYTAFRDSGKLSLQIRLR